MRDYVLILSHSTLESVDAQRGLSLAIDLALQGEEVTLYLVQNGVFASEDWLRPALASGVRVLADEFSLQERGISRRPVNVQASPLDFVLDRLEAGAQVIWH